MDKLNIEGRWWIAGTDNVVPGTLIRDENGLRLELNGSFTERTDEEIRKSFSQKKGLIFPSNEETILGITKDGKPITLEYYAIKEGKIFIIGPGYDSESYPVHRFFENVHFPNPKEIKFKKMIVSLPYLFDWTDIKLVEATRTYDDNNKPLSACFKCSPGENTHLGEYGGLKIYLRTFVTTPFFPTAEIKIKQDTHLVLESKNKLEISIEDFKVILFSIRDFLSMAIGCDVLIQHVIAFADTNQRIISKEKTYNPEVIVHENFLQPRAVPVKNIRKELMSFTLNDLLPNPEIIINSWLNMSRDMKDVFNLYFSTLTTSSLNIRNKFLSIVSAIEGIVRSDRSMRNTDLKPILQSIHNSIKKYGHLFADDEFEIIANSRNKFTHIELRDPSKKIFKNHELNDVTKKLSAMLEIRMLMNLGFKDETLDRIAKQKIVEAKR
ncbi:MAG: hypothetical protein KAS32_17600 [Candidatus Peribacteraceae bacterium]|nr:hypothetical protein [Candidatus Peribacteraceae bacterium]